MRWARRQVVQNPRCVSIFECVHVCLSFCVVESEKDALRFSSASEFDGIVGELRVENAGEACFKE